MSALGEKLGGRKFLAQNVVYTKKDSFSTESNNTYFSICLNKKLT
jgi:hypothetical protein